MRGSAGGRIEKIIAAGGFDSRVLSTVEVYDLSTDTWTKGMVDGFLISAVELFVPLVIVLICFIAFLPALKQLLEVEE